MNFPFSFHELRSRAGFPVLGGTVPQLALLLLSLLRNSWEEAQSRSQINAEEAPQCGWSPETHCCGTRLRGGLAVSGPACVSEALGWSALLTYKPEGPQGKLSANLQNQEVSFLPATLFLFSKETFSTVEKISNFFLIR